MPRQFSKPPRLSIVTQSQPLYFVTFCTMHRRRLLANDAVHDAFRQYAQAGLEHGVGVGQYVLMPEHAHLFVRMSGEVSLGRWVGGLKRAMGKAVVTEEIRRGEPVVTAVPAVPVTREEQDAAGTSLRQGYVGQAAATTEDRESEAPVVTAVSAVAVTREDKDAADTAATTEDRIQPFDVSRNLWQPGFFDHLLRHDESYAEKWLYVRDNPVRKRLVATWDAWPYRGEIVVIDRA